MSSWHPRRVAAYMECAGWRPLLSRPARTGCCQAVLRQMCFDPHTRWCCLMHASDMIQRRPKEKSSAVLQRSPAEPARHDEPLEFLYSAKALSLARRLCGGNRDWKCKPSRHAISNNQKRWHSSAAMGSLAYAAQNENGAPALSGQDTHIQPTSSPQSTDLRLYPRQAFDALPWPGTEEDMDQAWHLYATGQGISQREIIHYLSQSARLIDAERVRSVFNGMSYAAREPWVYSAAISALLQLKHTGKAVKIHEEARERRFTTPFGTSILFSYAIRRKNWVVAFRVWHTYWTEVQQENAAPTLWDEVVKWPSLSERALSLAVYASKTPDVGMDDPRLQHPADFLKFVSGVIRTAIFSTRKPDEQTVLRLFAHLVRLRLDRDQHYEKAILHFFQIRKTSLALRLYEHYHHQSRSRLPSRVVLHAAMFAYCDADNVLGVQFVLDDWAKYYGGPDRRTFERALIYSARRGDVAVVKALVAEKLKVHPRLRLDITHLAPLLQAHARRGELQNTIKLFNQMRSRYRVEPNADCWNILLYAYSKTEDLDGASKCFEYMRAHDIPVDNYTFGTLMNMCGRRGDLDGIINLIELAQERGMVKEEDVYDSLILGLVVGGELDEAERLADATTSMDLEGSRTRAWNYVLHGYVYQRGLADTWRIYDRMRTLKVPLDHLTYATIMQAYVIAKDPLSAKEMLDYVLPRDKVRITALHYAIVMGGYIRVGQGWMAFRIYQQMIKRGLKPTLSTNIALIRAAVTADKQTLAQQDSSHGPDATARAEEVLYSVLSSSDVLELTASSDPVRWKEEPINTAYPAAYFDSVISMYAQLGAFRKVESLYETYRAFAHQKGRDKVVAPPLRMLEALMKYANHCGDYEAVEKYWKLALSEAAKQVGIRSRYKTNQRGWVAPASRYLLAFSLTRYLQALSEQRKISEMKDAVEKMLWDGYHLDVTNWNFYVRHLAIHGQYEDAFAFCERELAPGWQGWWANRKRSEQFRVRLNQIDLRDFSRPFYKTLVHLARAVIDMQSAGFGADGENGRLGRIRALSPRTMDAIAHMPPRNDEVQRRLLRPV